MRDLAITLTDLNRATTKVIYRSSGADSGVSGADPS